jgi:hypothetical protein
VASLFTALRDAGVVGDLSRREAVLVHEQRLLLRLVQLLVVPADEAPEADRIRRAEWRDLRETILTDLQCSADDTNPAQRRSP